MSQPTNIEWTDFTWNPTRGCSRISEGCRNCYAEKIAGRFSGRGGAFQYFADKHQPGSKWTGRVEILEDHLLDPLKKRSWRGKRVFVNSMSDLFHEALPDEVIDRVFAVMAICHDITFQVLTKRAARMRDYWSPNGPRVSSIYRAAQAIEMPRGQHKPDTNWPWPNVHLGISAEDQPTLDDRTAHLLATPAAVRFVSLEPLLGPIDSRKFLPRRMALDEIRGSFLKPGVGLDWVITGGESGPGARPAHQDWFRAIRDDCKAASVPFFLKQITERGKKIPFDEWPADLQVREWPA